jgi:hypothetical protein
MASLILRSALRVLSTMAGVVDGVLGSVLHLGP